MVHRQPLSILPPLLSLSGKTRVYLPSAYVNTGGTFGKQNSAFETEMGCAHHPLLGKKKPKPDSSTNMISSLKSV